jgi:diaminopimelate decarboxylase
MMSVQEYINRVKTNLLIKDQLKYDDSFFVYFKNKIENNITLLKKTWVENFGPNSQLIFSIKANPNPHLLNVVSNYVDGFDVSSLTELNLMIKMGIPGTRITISGPAKTNHFFKMAKIKNVKAIHLDSFDEMAVWNAIKGENSLTKVTLRLRLSGNNVKKLGEPLEKVEEYLNKNRDDVKLDGFHLYLGRESYDPDLVSQHIGEIQKIKNNYKDHFTNEFAVYLGAGLASSSSYLDSIPNIPKWNHKISFPVHLESGRFIANDAGIYISKILSVKKDYRSIPLIIINGGLQHMAANMASPNLGLKGVICDYINHSTLVRSNIEKFIVYGSLGIRNDLVHSEANLPSNISRGDALIFSPVGAYGFTSGANQFISPGKIKEFLFSEKDVIDISPKYLNNYIFPSEGLA